MRLFIELLLIGLTTGAMNSLPAAGFGLVLSQTRVFHIAHGGVYLIAAYTYYYSSTRWGQPWFVGLLLTAAAALSGGLLIELVAYRQLLARQKLTFLSGFVASLGVLTIIANLFSLVEGGNFVQLKSSVLNHRISTHGLYLQIGSVVGLGVAVTLVFALWYWLRNTYSGMVLRGLSADRQLGRIYGLSVARYDMLATGIASLVLVPAAVLLPLLSGLSSADGLTIGTTAFTATIIGGVGNLAGTFAAAVSLGIIESVSVYWLPGLWQEAIGLGIMAVVLLVRPQGLFVRGGRPATVLTEVARA